MAEDEGEAKNNCSERHEGLNGIGSDTQNFASLVRTVWKQATDRLKIRRDMNAVARRAMKTRTASSFATALPTSCTH